jgi:pteridine reductase
MENHNRKLAGRTALVTGAAKRLGAAIARALHADGMNLLLHYNRSEADAQALCKELNAVRADSAAIAQADLANVAGLESLVKAALQWDGLDVLVNNASTFKPTPLGQVGEDDWDELMASNLKAPFFLAQAAAVQLRKNHGSIVTSTPAVRCGTTRSTAPRRRASPCSPCPSPATSDPRCG